MAWNFVNVSMLGTQFTELIEAIKSSGGGGGGGGNYTETVLFDYREDNGGVIAYANDNFTLRDSIDNYDDIILEFVSYSGDIGGSFSATCQTRVNVNMLKNAYTPYNFNYTSYAGRVSRIHLEGDSFSTIIRGEYNTNGLVKIVGIKY